MSSIDLPLDNESARQDIERIKIFGELLHLTANVCVFNTILRGHFPQRPNNFFKVNVESQVSGVFLDCDAKKH
jgi:hypothetical protein